MCLAENCRHIESDRESLWMFCIWHFLKNQHWELFSSSPCILGITGAHVSRGWVCFVHCSNYSFGRGWAPYKLDLDPPSLVRCRCIKSSLSWPSIEIYISKEMYGKCIKNYKTWQELGSFSLSWLEGSLKSNLPTLISRTTHWGQTLAISPL